MLGHGTIGLRGFDCNCRVSPAAARAYYAHGYRFVLRYVPREGTGAHDLTAPEVADVLGAGLGLGVVQHVKSETAWAPTEELGTAYGTNAARAAAAAGIPAGVVVWCDLEGVSTDVPAAVVSAYCRAWCTAVSWAGFLPGLYVGWHCILSGAALYQLPFQHYWAAYNCDGSEHPKPRGVQMQQYEAVAGDQPVDLGIDVDVICGDAEGGVPVFYVPGPDWPAV